MPHLTFTLQWSCFSCRHLWTLPVDICSTTLVKIISLSMLCYAPYYICYHKINGATLDAAFWVSLLSRLVFANCARSQLWILPYLFLLADLVFCNVLFVAYVCKLGTSSLHSAQTKPCLRRCFTRRLQSSILEIKVCRLTTWYGLVIIGKLWFFAKHHFVLW